MARPKEKLIMGLLVVAVILHQGWISEKETSDIVLENH